MDKHARDPPPPWRVDCGGAAASAPPARSLALASTLAFTQPSSASNTATPNINNSFEPGPAFSRLPAPTETAPSIGGSGKELWLLQLPPDVRFKSFEFFSFSVCEQVRSKKNQPRPLNFLLLPKKTLQKPVGLLDRASPDAPGDWSPRRRPGRDGGDGRGHLLLARRRRPLDGRRPLRLCPRRRRRRWRWRSSQLFPPSFVIFGSLCNHPPCHAAGGCDAESAPL